MFCTSLRSLCDGRMGIGVAGAVGGAEDEVAMEGKGGGGPVGDVGIGDVGAIAIPTAGLCREFVVMSPLLGIRCGTTGTEPMGG